MSVLELEDNELELRSLLTMARLASSFTLGFVVANHTPLLDEACEWLGKQLGGDAVSVVPLEPTTKPTCST